MDRMLGQDLQTLVKAIGDAKEEALVQTIGKAPVKATASALVKTAIGDPMEAPARTAVMADHCPALN